MGHVCNVCLLSMPNWRFSGPHALKESRAQAKRYLQAVRNYADTGDDRKLIRALSKLGYDIWDVAWHLERPGKIMPHEFTSFRDQAARNYYGQIFDPP